MKADFTTPIVQLTQTGITIRSMHIDFDSKQVVAHIARVDSNGVASGIMEPVALQPADAAAIVTLFTSRIGAPLSRAVGATLTNVQE